jgi:hypothetical protein
VASTLPRRELSQRRTKTHGSSGRTGRSGCSVNSPTLTWSSLSLSPAGRVSIPTSTTTTPTRSTCSKARLSPQICSRGTSGRPRRPRQLTTPRAVPNSRRTVTVANGHESPALPTQHGLARPSACPRPLSMRESRTHDPFPARRALADRPPRWRHDLSIDESGRRPGRDSHRRFPDGRSRCGQRATTLAYGRVPGLPSATRFLHLPLALTTRRRALSATTRSPALAGTCS